MFLGKKKGRLEEQPRKKRGQLERLRSRTRADGTMAYVTTS